MLSKKASRHHLWWRLLLINTQAQQLGASYITAGHIFATDCKKGLPPRGLGFLKDICRRVDIPVYAIGGITEENMVSALEAGAEGVCIMSGLMKI